MSLNKRVRSERSLLRPIQMLQIPYKVDNQAKLMGKFIVVYFDDILI